MLFYLLPLVIIVLSLLLIYIIYDLIKEVFKDAKYKFTRQSNSIQSRRR